MKLMILWVAAALLFSGTALASPDVTTPTVSPKAPQTSKKKPKKEEEIEEIEEVTPTKAPVKKKGAKDLSLLQIFGRMHPAFVHLPLAWLLLLFLGEWYALIVQKWALDKWTFALLVLTVLSLIPTVASGLLRASHMQGAGAEMGAQVLLHRNLMFAVAGAVLIALIMRIAMRKDFAGPLRGVYCLLISAAMGLAGYGGHLGAKLVYGKDFLPF